MPVIGKIAWLLAAAALLLAGCGQNQPPPTAYRGDWLSGPACVRLLAERGIPVRAWQGGTRACPIDTPVRAGAGRTSIFKPPVETSCAMLLAWSDFEHEVDRAARANMGSPLAAVRHYGSFACRRMIGNAGRPSLHAQARALDISGFELANGRVVTVVKGWRGAADQRRFLRAVVAAACRQFAVVLTPDSDRFHQDHIHIDIGPWRQCGV